MTVDDSAILKYCEDHSSPVADYLKALERETHIKTLKPSYISGFCQGRFLSLISHLHKPKFVVEIGTFTGYSTLCFAEGLAPNGKILSFEINQELEPFHTSFFPTTPYHDQIEIRYQDALEGLNEIKDQIDIVFIDAAKRDYSEFHDLICSKVRSGGLIIADNVLWKGKILAGQDNKSVALRAYNKKVLEDEQLVNMLLPLSDGYQIMIKK